MRIRQLIIKRLVLNGGNDSGKGSQGAGMEMKDGRKTQRDMEKCSGKELSEKRRRRVERFKIYIRSIRFVKRNFIVGVCLLGVAVSLSSIAAIYCRQRQEDRRAQKPQEQREADMENSGGETGGLTAGITEALDNMLEEAWERVQDGQVEPPSVLPEYRTLHEQNNDMIGWLSIEGTNIDYPVMQTPGDEQHYLYLDFYGQENKNGCLIMDTDSEVGDGTKAEGYADGTAPATNLIIHGHTMKSGEMFGNLKLYAEESYGKEHHTIRFDSLYEHREYELLAVFYSQVYWEMDEVFKYYNFFQADTQEEFDEWYENIREMSLYDTGVAAEFGDEFITLSCCAYHTENGRFVVVGKRVE